MTLRALLANLAFFALFCVFFVLLDWRNRG